MVDEHEEVLGVISASDILGGRPMRVAIDAGRQHVLVVDGERMVCGIVSLSQIARQLGVSVATGARWRARSARSRPLSDR
jgi:hypothetical protein